MPPKAPSFPTPFGRYTLIRKLAKGGMAELFLAKSPQRREPVVIKRVLPSFDGEDQFLRMFLNEARIAAQLDHPNIAKVFDLGRENGQLYLAMEYIDGLDLELVLKAAGGRIPAHLAARIAADACDALYYANTALGVDGRPLDTVHRDVTPGNVMITRNGQVKLVDFGIAKAAASLEKTRPGIVKGKFAYMSPEQIDQLTLDGRSDLFSVGAMLYEITVGKRPFERENIVDTIRAITDWTPPPPVDLVKPYPRLLSDVVMRALHKNRDQRYPNGREMQRALLAVVNVLPDAGPAQLALYLRQLAKRQQALRAGRKPDDDDEATIAGGPPVDAELALAPPSHPTAELTSDELTRLLDRARGDLEAPKHSQATVPGKKVPSHERQLGDAGEDTTSVSAPDPFDLNGEGVDELLAATLPEGTPAAKKGSPTGNRETAPGAELPKAPAQHLYDDELGYEATTTSTASSRSSSRLTKVAMLLAALLAMAAVAAAAYQRYQRAKEAAAQEAPASAPKKNPEGPKAGAAASDARRRTDDEASPSAAAARKADEEPLAPDSEEALENARPKKAGKVEFKGKTGLDVYLDGSERATCPTTPCTITLPEGPHTARINDKTKTFTVLPGKTVTVKLP